MSGMKVIEELIALTLMGAIYLMAFAPILSTAVANYTGGGDVGTALGTVVGYLPIVVVAIIFIRIALGAFHNK